MASRLALWDIDDAEQFAGAIVARSGLKLGYHDRADLVEYLLVECWELSLRYEPGRISFSSWAGRTLRFRLVDWQRRQGAGRTVWRFKDRVHVRSLPQFVPFDSERDRVDELESSGAGDPAADCSPDLERLLAGGSSQRARDEAELGLDPPRRAAG